MTFAWIASIECRIPREKLQLSGILEGLKVLVLEDELLIAMDVEQLCLDHGASAVTVARTLSEVPGEDEFDTAMVDVLLDGVSTWISRKACAAEASPSFSHPATRTTLRLPDDFRALPWWESRIPAKI